MTRTYEEAFTEWARLYREDPAKFDSEWLAAIRDGKESPESYGRDCAAFFCRLLGEPDTDDKCELRAATAKVGA